MILTKLAINRAAPSNFSGRENEEASPYSREIKSFKRAKEALARAHFAPDPEGIQRNIYRMFPELNPKFRKGEKVPVKGTKKQKVKKIMSEFKDNELNVGKSDKKAIAIALSVSGQSKKKKK